MNSNIEPQARKIVLAQFTPMKAVFQGTPRAVEYKKSSYYEGYYPKYPVLIKSNGEPWFLGNLYMLRRLAVNTNYDSNTFNSIADSLLSFLRFLEAKSLEPLDFPSVPIARPTYAYKRFLIQQIQSGKLARSTASLHINRVVAFYKGLLDYQIIDTATLNLAFSSKKKAIAIINDTGFSQSLTISTTDLSIPTFRNASDSDFIEDEGKLKPLTQKQQTLLISELKNGDYGIYLMFAFSLLTGARIQTVGTLTIEALLGSKERTDGNYLLKTGDGTGVDTKFGKRHQLIIPKKLMKLILTYIESEQSIERREKSYFGNIDNNYVFLNRLGRPYYTSKAEQKARRDSKAAYKVTDLSAMEKESNSTGYSITRYIKDNLIPALRRKNKEFPDFSFHDLRATFGMNYLEELLKYVDEHNESKSEGEAKKGTMWVLEQVQERMGHKDLKVTMRYLDYRLNPEWKKKIIDHYEEKLLGLLSQGII